MVLSMELSLNVLWLLVAVASFAFVWRGGDSRSLACWHSLRRILSLTCALVIFFPVISLTDDLHAAQVVMEDSNPAKRVSKSSGAPGAASNLNGSPLPFMVAARLLAGQSLRRLGLTALLETRLLAAAPARWPNLRGPPTHA
jgi:hypothetical protein